jgi:hypothetical protein
MQIIRQKARVTSIEKNEGKDHTLTGRLGLARHEACEFAGPFAPSATESIVM